MDALAAIAEAHGLLLIEDCAQAFGASYKGRMLGSIGDVGTYSFNVYKTVTAGDGGMVVTSDEATYRRCFAVHDQGTRRCARGPRWGDGPTWAWTSDDRADAAWFWRNWQLRADRDALAREQGAARPGSPTCRADVREIAGSRRASWRRSDGLSCQRRQIARAVAAEWGTKVVADSGWHVYSNMEQLLEKRVPTAEGWPDRQARYSGPEVAYRKGMLPQTDALLARAINIGIGVRDAGLGSAFGVTVRDGADAVDACIEAFRRAAGKHLR